MAASATWFTAVPTIYEILLNRSAREFPGTEVAPLMFVRSASAPLNTVQLTLELGDRRRQRRLRHVARFRRAREVPLPGQPRNTPTDGTA